MKNLFYIGLAALGLAALATCREGSSLPRLVAAQAPAVAAPPAAPSAIQGDLVLDFLGGVRGYVEPCG
ncbi:MAG TPA: hypothetical protein VGM37_06290 [Armatimonadota bacterium]|jgi:hypothetical protein